MKTIDMFKLTRRLPVALLLLAGAIVLAIPQAAQAQRTSIDTLAGDHNDLRQGHEDLKNRLDKLSDQLGFGNAATCTQLEFTGQIWGKTATGVDLRARTNSTLHFIGCIEGSCAPSSFFCRRDGGTETLTFGTNGTGAMRALVDPGNQNGDDMTGGPFACSSAADPDSISNAPDKPADATALCKALGYNAGTVVAVNSNTCPEAQSLSNTGLDWSSDWVGSLGFGKEYTCTGFAP